MTGYRRARSALVAERVAKLEGKRTQPDAQPEAAWPWLGIDRDDDLTHAAPIRELSLAVT